MFKDIVHPTYVSECADWEKFRYTYRSGDDFIAKYLYKHSLKETDTDFANRKAITYVPAHATAAINSIKNSIFLRMTEITRLSPSISYINAIKGGNGGVDLQNSSMNYYIGCIILPELLSMRKVGIFVDNPVYPLNASLLETQVTHPYLYCYVTEDIRSWSYDSFGQLKTLLLRNHRYINDEYGFPEKLQTTYKYIRTTADGVVIDIYDEEDNKLSSTILDLPVIPFVILELSHSLLKDAANYQIALLNLASADIHFGIKSNFPFYTEQYIPFADLANVNAPSSTIPESKIDIGVGQGRRYPKGLERPQFINPSPEPLRASIELKEQLIKELRQIININVATLDPRRASEESKKYDDRDLEAGLAAIGLELEDAERSIAKLWLAYEHNNKYNDTPLIKYPLTYALKTDKERREEAKELAAILEKVPSRQYQKILLKDIVDIIIGHKYDSQTLASINNEIDKATTLIIDPEIIRLDHEAGFVSTATASRIRGYPEGETEQAKKDHAERAARIVQAQTATKLVNPKSRGVPDLSSNDKEQPNG